VLCAISNIIREHIWHICGGILPLKLLDLNWRAITVWDIQSGMFPDKWLLRTLKTSSERQFFNEGGISPFSLFSCKWSEVRLDRKPIYEGILPDRLLLPKLIATKDFQFFQQFVSPPDRLFNDMSKNNKLFFPFNILLSHKRGETSPDNELLSNETMTTFGDN